VEILPPNGQEETFPSKKYLAVALIAAAIGGALIPVCLPVSIALFIVSSWYLWSAAIIVANQKASGSSIEKPAHQLHAWAMEVNAGVTAACLFPLTIFQSYHSPKGHPQGRPILMVNGYLSFGSTWHYQRQKLLQAGFGPIYTMNVGSGKSIKTYAEQIQEKVRKIQKETQRNDLILIGHSKGGLVSSYYATQLAEKDQIKVTDVITIGSPLKGTPLAYFGPGLDAYEMRPHSPFHEELRKKIGGCSKTRFFHIASQSDNVVSHGSALLGNNPARQLLLKDVGHLSLVFSSRVANQLCYWLQ
jgi:predicted alpha/beta hydrolase family esterase